MASTYASVFGSTIESLWHGEEPLYSGLPEHDLTFINDTLNSVTMTNVECGNIWTVFYLQMAALKDVNPKSLPPSTASFAALHAVTRRSLNWILLALL
jgi:hypothetical protein